MLEIEKELKNILLSNCNSKTNSDLQQNCNIPENLQVIDNISSTI
jgi:hypothetical protein